MHYIINSGEEVWFWDWFSKNLYNLRSFFLLLSGFKFTVNNQLNSINTYSENINKVSLFGVLLSSFMPEDYTVHDLCLKKWLKN